MPSTLFLVRLRRNWIARLRKIYLCEWNLSVKFSTLYVNSLGPYVKYLTLYVLLSTKSALREIIYTLRRTHYVIPSTLFSVRLHRNWIARLRKSISVNEIWVWNFQHSTWTLYVKYLTLYLLLSTKSALREIVCTLRRTHYVVPSTLF